MNNKDVEGIIESCKQELADINTMKKMLGPTSPIMMFLTRYSLIKSCGTIELAYKTIVADFCENTQSLQVKNFISNKVRNSSRNPTLGNIDRLLLDFDENWQKDFFARLKAIVDHEKISFSLRSLNDARNEFAHGGNPSISFENVENYFEDSRKIICILDEVVK